MKRLTVPVVVLVLGVFLLSLVLPLRSRAQTAGTRPANSATTQAAARKLEPILKEIQATSQELAKTVPQPSVLLTEQGRKELGPKAVPLFRKLSSLVEEIGTVDPRFKQRANAERNQYRAILVMLGDEQTVNALNTEATGKDASESLAAKLTLNLGKWWRSSKDPKAQEVVLASMRQIARDNPKEEEPILRALMAMSQTGAANKQLSRGAEDIIIQDMHGQIGKAVGEELAEARRVHDLYDQKPIALAGTTFDAKGEGRKFSTADWKGKVILVDFWATWCPPCLEELPRLKGLYDKYHKQGLEIVGVSSDRQASDLTDFLKTDKDLVWPVLFDPAKPGMHVLAKQYGISAYPTMFLIDRNGILRDMEARANLEEEIPKLLAEKPGTTQPATAPVAQDPR